MTFDGARIVIATASSPMVYYIKNDLSPRIRGLRVSATTCAVPVSPAANKLCLLPSAAVTSVICVGDIDTAEAVGFSLDQRTTANQGYTTTYVRIK